MTKKQLKAILETIHYALEATKKDFNIEFLEELTKDDEEKLTRDDEYFNRQFRLAAQFGLCVRIRLDFASVHMQGYPLHDGFVCNNIVPETITKDIMDEPSPLQLLDSDGREDYIGSLLMSFRENRAEPTQFWSKERKPK
jgi:hypothetical protein